MGWLSQKAPDMTAQNTAAASQASMSREQLAWAKQVYAETAGDRASASRRAAEVSDVQIDAMRKQSAITEDYDRYNRETFRPLERKIVQEAQDYDTPERREAASNQAMAGVEQQISMQRTAGAQALARRGADPGSGKSLAMQAELDLGAAKLKAGASSQANRQVEAIGAARRMDAVSLGRGLAANQATSASVAMNQGNSSSAQLASIGGIQAQGNQIMNSGFAGAQSGMAGAANTYGNIASIEQKAGDNSGLWGAIGQMGGAAVSVY